MLRISKLADYSILIMRCLFKSGQALSAAQVAEVLEMSLPTTRKILKQLQSGGLLHASRGAQGGYGLSQNPASISLAQIIEAIDGPIAMTACNQEGNHCERAHRCELKPHWQSINHIVKQHLDSVYLSELLSKQNKPKARLAAEAE